MANIKFLVLILRAVPFAVGKGAALTYAALSFGSAVLAYFSPKLANWANAQWQGFPWWVALIPIALYVGWALLTTIRKNADTLAEDRAKAERERDAALARSPGSTQFALSGLSVGNTFQDNLMSVGTSGLIPDRDPQYALDELPDLFDAAADAVEQHMRVAENPPEEPTAMRDPSMPPEQASALWDQWKNDLLAHDERLHDQWRHGPLPLAKVAVEEGLIHRVLDANVNYRRFLRPVPIESPEELVAILRAAAISLRKRSGEED